jgi:hypothetical protein
LDENHIKIFIHFLLYALLPPESLEFCWMFSFLQGTYNLSYSTFGETTTSLDLNFDTDSTVLAYVERESQKALV